MRTLTPKQKDNAKVVMRRLMATPDPMPKKSAAAVVGNGGVENEMKPVTTGPKDHGSDGLLQWRQGRLADLKRTFPGTWSTLESQADFFKIECKRDYPKLWAQLVDPRDRTIANLTANICVFYERPNMAVANLDQRIAYAEEAANLSTIEIPEPLKPAVEGQGSSLVGIICAGLAFWLFHNNAPILQYGPLAVLGLTWIFLIGPASEKEAPPPQQKEEEMDPLKVVQILEGMLTLLEKVAADLPQIKQELSNLSAIVVPLQNLGTHTPVSDERIKGMIDRINNLGV